jgi:hypothetical protein
VKRELSIYFCRVIRFLTVLGRFPRRSGFGFRAADAVDDAEELVDTQPSSGGKGSIVEKKIPCGKNCGGCPHGPYKYRVWREGDQVKTEYLGTAD